LYTAVDYLDRLEVVDQREDLALLGLGCLSHGLAATSKRGTFSMPAPA
jgi:hypothetical protein